jgi:hypothetical protein
MADSSLNAPLLRVSRPVSACSRCRNAKVKVHKQPKQPRLLVWGVRNADEPEGGGNSVTGNCLPAPLVKSRARPTNVQAGAISSPGERKGGTYCHASYCASPCPTFVALTHGWGGSYIASLESKIEKLEKKLAALDSRRASSVSVADSSPLIKREDRARGNLRHRLC